MTFLWRFGCLQHLRLTKGRRLCVSVSRCHFTPAPCNSPRKVLTILIKNVKDCVLKRSQFVDQSPLNINKVKHAPR